DRRILRNRSTRSNGFSRFNPDKGFWLRDPAISGKTAMIVRSFLSFALPFIPAYMMVRAALYRTSGATNYVLQFFLSFGLALGISSCTYFLWLTKPVPGLPGLF